MAESFDSKWFRFRAEQQRVLAHLIDPCADHDYYAMLEIPNMLNITQRHIRYSYNCLFTLVRPDRNFDSNALEAFRKLRRVYKALDSKDKQEKYDREYVFRVIFPTHLLQWVIELQHTRRVSLLATAIAFMGAIDRALKPYVAQDVLNQIYYESYAFFRKRSPEDFAQLRFELRNFNVDLRKRLKAYDKIRERFCNLWPWLVHFVHILLLALFTRYFLLGIGDEFMWNIDSFKPHGNSTWPTVLSTVFHSVTLGRVYPWLVTLFAIMFLFTRIRSRIGYWTVTLSPLFYSVDLGLDYPLLLTLLFIVYLLAPRIRAGLGYWPVVYSILFHLKHVVGCRWLVALFVIIFLSSSRIRTRFGYALLSVSFTWSWRIQGLGDGEPDFGDLLREGHKIVEYLLLAVSFYLKTCIYVATVSFGLGWHCPTLHKWDRNGIGLHHPQHPETEGPRPGTQGGSPKVSRSGRMTTRMPSSGVVSNSVASRAASRVALAFFLAQFLRGVFMQVMSHVISDIVHQIAPNQPVDDPDKLDEQ